MTSATVAYIEQRFGGLVFEMSYCGGWCSVMLSLWFAERTGWLEAGRTTETTDLIVLTFSKRLYLRLFVYVLTIVSISLCLLSLCLPACLSRKCLPFCLLATHLPCDFHVSVCLPFGLSAVSYPCLLSRHFTDSQ